MSEPLTAEDVLAAAIKTAAMLRTESVTIPAPYARALLDADRDRPGLDDMTAALEATMPGAGPKGGRWYREQAAAILTRLAAAPAGLPVVTRVGQVGPLAATTPAPAIYATDSAMERGLRGSPPIDPAARDRPGLDVERVVKVLTNITQLTPGWLAAADMVNGEKALRLVAEAIARDYAALAEAQQREGAGRVGSEKEEG